MTGNWNECHTFFALTFLPSWSRVLVLGQVCHLLLIQSTAKVTTGSRFSDLIAKNAAVTCLQFVKCGSPTLVLKSIMVVEVSPTDWHSLSSSGRMEYWLPGSFRQRAGCYGCQWICQSGMGNWFISLTSFADFLIFSFTSSPSISSR